MTANLCQVVESVAGIEFEEVPPLDPTSATYRLTVGVPLETFRYTDPVTVALLN